MAKKVRRRNDSPTRAAKAPVVLTPQDKKTIALARRHWPMASSRRAERRHASTSGYPHPLALQRPLQQDANGSSRWARQPTAANCSISPRPRATCRPCSWPAAARQLIEEGKTTSIRGLFYLLKHTIEGTKEETFDDQEECDPVIEDIEVLLNSLREELHLYAQKRGDMVGEIVADRQRRRDRLLADGLGRLRHPVDRRAGGDPVQEVRGQVRPARRKGHGLAAVQRRQVLAQAQLHPDPRRRPAAARRAPAAPPPAQRTEAARLLPVGQRPVGVLHLQRHQARLDQSGLRIAADGHSRRQVPRPAEQGFRALRLVAAA